MPKNNAKKWAVICLIIGIIGAVMMVAGLTVEEYDLIWLFAVGLLLALTFIICFFIFMAQARRLNRMFNREELLAYWQFDQAQQQKKAVEEFRTRQKGNRLLLLIVVAFFVVIGGLFAVFGFDDIEDATGFLLIMGGALAIIALAAFLAPVLSYRKMRNAQPEVFVGPFGAYVFGEYTQWKAPMTRACQVIYESSPDAARINVEFEILQRYGWQKHNCRIPVPAGCEQQAYYAVTQIAGANAIPFNQGELVSDDEETNNDE